MKGKTAYHHYPLRHKFISWIGDIDVKGVRRLAAKLPDFLLKDPKKVGPIILKTNDDILLHIDPSIDNGVELSLYRTGTYEKGILHFIQKNYKGKGSFIDVGANIGLMSIYVAKMNANATIHAIEAHPDTLTILKDNISLNNLSNINVHGIAAGNQEGEVTIYDNWQVNRGGASIVVKGERSEGHSVSMKRLDDLAIESPEMLKIDVEGVELEVLKGASELIKKNIPTIIVEVSDQRENSHDSTKELIQFIESLGTYRFYKLKGGKERKSDLVEIKSDNDLPEHDNIICIAN